MNSVISVRKISRKEEIFGGTCTMPIVQLHCRGISRAGLPKRKERGTFLRTACHLRWPLTLCTYTKHNINTNTNANTNTNTYIKKTQEKGGSPS